MSSASPERTRGAELGDGAEPGDPIRVGAGPTVARIDQPAALSAWAAGLELNPYADGWGRFSRSVAARLAELPAELAEPIRRFRARLGDAGVLHLRGLPVPPALPPTPRVPFVQLREPVGTEPYLVAIGLLLGEVYGFADWHGGDRVQNMYPLPTEARAQNAHNSVYLHLHTETAFRPDTPHALVLLCLRSDPGAVTVFADLAGCADALDPSLRAQLTRPAFAFLSGTEASGLTEPKPIFDGHRWNYAEALVGIDEAAERALVALQRVLSERATAVALHAGEALVLDNLHVVHGRSAYQPSYNGSDRWLQRCLVGAVEPATDPGRRSA